MLAAVGGGGVAILGLLFVIPSAWIGLATSVRRLHDLNQPGWMAVATLIPLANIVVLLLLGSLSGTAGTNNYGADPRVGLLLVSPFGPSGSQQFSEELKSFRAAAIEADVTLPDNDQVLLAILSHTRAGNKKEAAMVLNDARIKRPDGYAYAWSECKKRVDDIERLLLRENSKRATAS